MDLLKKILVILVVCSLSASAFAQQRPAQATTFSGPKRQMATIIFSGLGGAVLGLSTLSFYGRPQDHLSNIAIGFGVGVIVGTVYTTYRAATNPGELYSPNLDPSLPSWEREERWVSSLQSSTSSPLAQWTFSF